MAIVGIHHVSFTVTDLERTVAFYQDLLGMQLCGRKHRRAADLGTAMFGAAPEGDATSAEILIAEMELDGTSVEFIQYVDPATRPYPGDPSVAGSGHLAILTHDIEAEVSRLQAAGVSFHTPVRTVRDPGRPVWRRCYFPDPDGICVELVESLASDAAEAGGTSSGREPTCGEAAHADADHGEACHGDTADRETALLETGDYGVLERRRSEKRLDWLTTNGYPARRDSPFPATPVSPREAYELLLLEYMGLSPDQVPVVDESPDHIVWLSTNDCPTMEACRRLGLDTRRVCRAVAERPVQSFLSRLDPRLRFVRDYTAIRPHADHCREQILRLDLEDLMRDAIGEAVLAKAEGNKGYGSLLLMGDRVLARTHDTAVTTGDPSLHAEHSAILEAIRREGTPDLTGSLLVSTCEPCPMCTGLAVWAGVTTIVFGSSIPDTAAMGRTRIMVTAAQIAELSPRVLEVIGGVLREECDPLYA
jgi:tRNA(Arg) A34 adenosine deaminase TadA/catechol 2,3-dioxygenase-like lactoylglutathione lyase family enzyme